MPQLTLQARKSLSRISEMMTKEDYAKFSRDLHQLWDEIITGDIQREFKVTLDDIIFLLKRRGFGTSESSIKKLIYA